MQAKKKIPGHTRKALYCRDGLYGQFKQAAEDRGYALYRCLNIAISLFLDVVEQGKWAEAVQSYEAKVEKIRRGNG